MIETELTLEQLAPQTHLILGKDGLYINTKDGFSDGNLHLSENEQKKATAFGLVINQIIPILLEQDIAELRESQIIISYENIFHLYNAEYGLLNFLPKFCPYNIEIESTRGFGDKDFRYQPRFLYNNQEVFTKRYGCFIKRAGSIYCLTQNFYELLEEIKKFNDSDDEQKQITESLLVFNKIKSLSHKVNAQLGTFLNSNEVIVPEKIELGLEHDINGRITVYPVIDGVSEEELQKKYLAFTEAQSIYDLETQEKQGRIRVVLQPEIQEIISKMRPLSRISGKEKEKLITSPREVFSDISNPDCLDLSNYGPRVKGIGAYVFQPKFVIKTPFKLLDQSEFELFPDANSSKPACEITIEAIDTDGEKVTIPISNREFLDSVAIKIDEARDKGEGVINLTDSEGKELIIPITSELQKGIQCILNKIDNKNLGKMSDFTNDDRRYVLIYENEEILEYSETKEIEEDFSFKNNLKDLLYYKPESLNLNIELKQFQKDGVAWLQSAFKDFRHRGVLLADEMGLGKTLQVLTFLAWFIESGYRDEFDKPQFKDKGPYKPILIVAPKILLENWVEEIQKFFKDYGDIFLPYKVLYGDEIKSFNNSAVKRGREYESGKNSLDIEKLKSQRLIITNYDTVKNYQHSFAQVEWSVVVADESQEIKDQKTSVTNSMKALNTLFRIAMTGTPVENRLLDLWNIIEFAQPGLLGTSKEFSKSFEADIFELNEAARLDRSQVLKKKLNHNKSSAYLVRRTKEDNLKELPKKIIYPPIECPLSKEQEALHIEIIKNLNEKLNIQKGRHLGAIQKLRQIYEHIELAKDGFLSGNPEIYLEQSPKLTKVKEILGTIRKKNEKVLIFTMSVKMQQILKKVFDKEFNLDIDIINGSISTTASKKSGHTRFSLIKKFENRSGFNILILSPDVAGVGLNIIGANHVIHYGRWWNPAKEAQATDRAYRIGQKKEVYVYYPISVSDKFTSFDFKLHELLERKKSLASDFLIPTTLQNVGEKEMFEELIKDNLENIENKKTPSISFEQLKTLSPYEFESLTAVLHKYQGYKVIQTAKSQNEGINVIAIKEKTIVLIRCEHIISATPVDNGFIDEILQAKNYYERNVLSEDYRNYSFESVLVTNGHLLRETQKKAQERGIKVIEGKDIKDILKKYSVSIIDISQQEMDRLNSLNDISKVMSNESTLLINN